MNNRDKKRKKQHFRKKTFKQQMQVQSEINDHATIEALINLVVEAFKFCSSCMNVLLKLGENDSIRFKNKYEWFYSQVIDASKKAGLTIQDFTGLDYDVGYPVNAINLEDFEPDKKLIISYMLEPVIMMEGKVKHMGVVMLEEKEKI